MPFSDPEARSKYNRQYYLARREEIIQKTSEYAKSNRDKINNRNREKGLTEEQKIRQKIYLKEYLIKNREKILSRTREYHLKKKYGLSLLDYEELLLVQGRCCALCGLPFLDLNRSPDVDHCHVTGKVRGLLHLHWNTLIGHAKDDIFLLFKAIEYLLKHSND